MTRAVIGDQRRDPRMRVDGQEFGGVKMIAIGKDDLFGLIVRARFLERDMGYQRAGAGRIEELDALSCAACRARPEAASRWTCRPRPSTCRS